MFVAAIATMGLGAFFASCADDSCICTYVSGPVSYDEAYTTTEFEVATCGQVEDLLQDSSDALGFDFEISCK